MMVEVLFDFGEEERDGNPEEEIFCFALSTLYHSLDMAGKSIANQIGNEFLLRIAHKFCQPY